MMTEAKDTDGGNVPSSYPPDNQWAHKAVRHIDAQAHRDAGWITWDGKDYGDGVIIMVRAVGNPTGRPHAR